MMTRKKLEALVWKRTHRDFKGRSADGTRSILHNEGGVTYGTESWPLSKFTTDQLIAKLPSRVRAEHGLELAKRDASRHRSGTRVWSVWSYGYDGEAMHVESFRDKGAAKARIARLRASHPGVRYELRRPKLSERRTFGTRAHTRAHRDSSHRTRASSRLRSRRSHRDEIRSRGPSSFALYQVRAKGSRAAKRNFPNYGDAQRYAWDLLRQGKARVAMIYVRHDRGDHFGFGKRMEAWTIGKSGKFKHAY